MNTKRKFSRKKNCIVFTSSVIALIFAFFILNVSLLPDHIQITEINNRIELEFPLNTEVQPVSAQERKVQSDYSQLSHAQAAETAEDTSSEVILTALGLPLKRVSLSTVNELEVVPCGITVGVRIDTEGVMVLGTGYVTDDNGQAQRPCDGLLKAGDLILTANGVVLQNKEQLVEAIDDTGEVINFTVKRDGEVITVNVVPVKSSENGGSNKIGLWVRDSTQGIGTVTYYNPTTGKFGALGHGIMDVDTKQIMSVKSGSIMETEIKSIKQGKKGSPGELVGDINKNSIIGQVKLNNEYGLYGVIDKQSDIVNMEPMKIALQNEVHEGPAKILANIEGTEVKEYDVYIEAVNKFSSDDSKGMVVKITDTQLLSKTNGIVQGMSGSPIIQDSKLVGAVTHVFVQDPTKGYGIFIENMIKQENLFSQVD